MENASVSPKFARRKPLSSTKERRNMRDSREIRRNWRR
jgi:hypothetical protein